MTGSGWEGVVAPAPRLSQVEGERGGLFTAGSRGHQRAAHATFEETTWLLWHGSLPAAAQLETFRDALAGVRRLPEATLALLRECARRQMPAMDALRVAAGTLSLESDEATGIVARVPVIVAFYWRLRHGREPIPPRHDLGHAANFLYLLSGDPPDAQRGRALETYLNTVIDHWLKASP